MIVSSRKIDGCQAVADAITAEGGKATAIACHIGEMEQIQNVFAQIREQFGRLDILVNNAATNPQFCNVLKPTSAPSRRPSTSTSAATTSCPSRAAS